MVDHIGPREAERQPLERGHQVVLPATVAEQRLGPVVPGPAMEFDPQLRLGPAEVETAKDVVVVVHHAVLADRWREVHGPEELDVAGVC